jgi:uncharacterized DUF497 family protein
MRYEWDDQKRLSNLQKHGIEFADAVSVLDDTAALTRQDTESEEVRFVTLGTDAIGRLLVVVYTYRGEDVIRLISARRATRPERASYER